MKAITPSRIDLSNIAQDNLSESISVLKCAKNPIVMIGGGVRTANATDRVQQFLQASKFPYVSTLMGLDAVDHNSERYLGFIGSYGNRWANEALSKADVLLVLGSRLDVRQTGTDIKAFLANKTIIRVDADSSELSGRVKSSIEIYADLNCVIDQLLDSKIEAQENPLSHEATVSRRLYPQIGEQEIDLELNPNYVMEQISVKFKDANGYVVDVGQHQMWAAQSLRIQNHQRFLTSGGLGSMGFAIPASIGASFYSTGRWVVIVGDGCLQLSIQELQTISHYKLPITIVILNNSQHGMVAQFQEENLEGRFTGTRDGFSNPNFKLISEAFGFQNYTRIHAKEDLDSFVTSPPLTSNGPELVEIIIDQRAKALPKMKFHS
jgi:acetolactate synthase-1/2/3 large subunit